MKDGEPTRENAVPDGLCEENSHAELRDRLQPLYPKGRGNALMAVSITTCLPQGAGTAHSVSTLY